MRYSAARFTLKHHACNLEEFIMKKSALLFSLAALFLSANSFAGEEVWGTCRLAPTNLCSYNYAAGDCTVTFYKTDESNQYTHRVVTEGPLCSRVLNGGTHPQYLGVTGARAHYYSLARRICWKCE